MYIVIGMLVIGLSFYLNLCYKKHKYRREMFNSLVHLQEHEKNKSIVKAALSSELNKSNNIENTNAKLMKIILPLNVIFIGYCSVAMTNKFFIIFLFLVSIHMITFIFDKTLNIKFGEAIQKLMAIENN